ncbi:MAG: hypothetical protein HGB19_14640, partial [Chlorobiales bacterium]|nr:hypothetical protein [Chlorobiales bacterium]
MKTFFQFSQILPHGQWPNSFCRAGGIRGIFLLVIAANLFSGCGSAEKAARIPDTPVAPNWFKAAEVKSEKLNTHLRLQAPADVKGKRVTIAHPDTTVKESGTILIGDVAEIAYLAKVVNVYIRTEAQDAAKAYLNGISQPETLEPSRWYGEQAIARALNIAPKAAERLDSLSKSGNTLFDGLEEEVKTLIAAPTLAAQDEIHLFGLLEKMNVLATTQRDMLTTASAE